MKNRSKCIFTDSRSPIDLDEARLISSCYDIVIGGSDPDDLTRIKNLLADGGIDVNVYCYDIQNSSSVKDFASFASDGAKVDLLINNSIVPSGEMLSGKIFDTNAMGTIYMGKYFSPAKTVYFVPFENESVLAKRLDLDMNSAPDINDTDSGTENYRRKMLSFIYSKPAFIQGHVAYILANSIISWFAKKTTDSESSVFYYPAKSPDRASAAEFIRNLIPAV